MARPRRKVSKQKQQLQKMKKKSDKQEKRNEDLDALKQKQKERRRRLLWGEENGNNHHHHDHDHDHDGETDSEEYEDDDYDEDEEEDDDSENEYYEHSDNDGEDEECETSCPNPGCSNYSINACHDFQMPPNAFLVRSIFEDVPPLTVAKLEGIVRDSRNESYGPLEVRRAGAKDFLVTCLEAKDLERVIRDGAITIDKTFYPAYALPTGTEGDFFRDYNLRMLSSGVKMNPWFTTVGSDFMFGLRAEYKSHKEDYTRLEKLLMSARDNYN